MAAKRNHRWAALQKSSSTAIKTFIAVARKILVLAPFAN
jgi:hypothetical protein